MENEELIEFTLKVTPAAVRVLRSYLALSGRSATEVSEEIGVEVSALLVDKLKAKIAGELGIEQAKPRAVIASGVRQPPAQVFLGHQSEDITGISEGLGDVDPEPIEGEENPDALVPQSGGLTAEQIDQDMQVENPEVEAAGEPPSTWADQMAQGTDPANLFAEAAGINTNDNRLQKRRKRDIGKGKVTGLTEAGLRSSEAST